jgi:hypothetical protein
LIKGSGSLMEGYGVISMCPWKATPFLGVLRNEHCENMLLATSG